MNQPPTTLCIGDFELDPAARELRRDGALVELPSSAFDGLVYLIRHRDRAVGRDELMAAIWGRSDVADSLLGQTLMRLRRTLGDSGEAQQWIRTVPRFGYRWVGPVSERQGPVEAIAVEAPASVLPSLPDAATGHVAAGEAASAGIAVSDGATPATDDGAVDTDLAALTTTAAVTTEAKTLDAVQIPTAPAAFFRRQWRALAAVAAVLLAVAGWALLAPRPTADAPTPTRPPLAQQTAAAAVVLPARIQAGEEWGWLRLGLMDLVAGRLRRGALATAASESVVSLLRDAETEDNAAIALRLRESGLAGDDTVQIFPEVELVSGQWLVRLQARQGRRELTVETRADDAIRAAREATDTLLLRLGHLPPDQRDEAPQALTELLQRTRAAMLADQLQLAVELIRRADSNLRERPEIVLRQAQIELRAGDYLAVEQRLLQLLDTVSPERDAELRGRALVTLAASYIRRERPADAAIHYDEAIRLLRQGQAPEALGLALLGRGLVATLAQRYDAALADLGLARSEMESAGNALGVGQVDLNLALIEVLRRRPATALGALVDTAARFQRLGAQEEFVFTLASIAEVQQLLLDHEAALATTERYWPPPAHSQNLRLRWKLSLVRAQALFEAGRLDATAQLVRELLDGSDAALDQAVRAKAAVLPAQIAAARGEHARAAELARAALTPALEQSDRCRYLQTWALRLRALRRQGELAQAQRETGEFTAWTQRQSDPWSRAQAALAQAEQAAAESRTEPALALYQQALDLLDTAGAVPDDLVDAVQPYADTLIRDGQLDRARAVTARIAAWADHDLRAASVFVQINAALGRPKALQAAERRAALLAGERPLVAISR